MKRCAATFRITVGIGALYTASSTANSARTTRSRSCSTSIYAAPGRSRAKRAPFSNEPIVKAPGSRLSPRAGCFSSLQLPGLHPAEALQAPYDRGAGALKMRLELSHIAARVIHLQQGAVVRLRPRLARIGR